MNLASTACAPASPFGAPDAQAEGPAVRDLATSLSARCGIDPVATRGVAR